MKRFRLGGAALAFATAGALLSSIPAQATHINPSGSGSITPITGGVSGVDNSGDAAFSFSCVDDGHAGNIGPVNVPGTGREVGECGNQFPELDIRSYHLKRIDLPGGPGLEASWTLGAALPPENVTTPPVVRGTDTLSSAEFYTQFRTVDLLDNRPHAGCERATSTAARRTYVYNLVGHRDDQWQYFVNFGLTYAGGKYIPSPTIGYYTPWEDGGYTFYDLKANTLLSKGTHYNWFYSADRKTVTVQVLGIVPESSTTCKFTPPSLEGINYVPFARTGAQRASFPADWGHGAAVNDTITNVLVQGRLGTVVTLPVKVPLSVVPGEEDLESIGGFVFLVDTSTIGGIDQFDGDVTAKNVGSSDAGGPGCWTPTFGGTAPPNPFHSPGNRCGIDSPIGDEWFGQGSFTY